MSDYGIGGRNWRKFWLGSKAAQPGTSDFKAAYLYAEGRDQVYKDAPSGSLLPDISVRLPRPFGPFLAGVAEELGRADGRIFGDIWREQIKNSLSSSHLTRTDRNQLETLGEVLGYLDLEMQLSSIDLYLEQLEISIREAESSIGAKQKLYQSLGIAGGIFLVILLI